MTENTPVVLSQNAKEHIQLDMGNVLSPNSMPVSATPGNSITVNTDGLYSSIATFIQTVSHNNSINGSGTTRDALGTRISHKDANRLQLINAAPYNYGGIYVPEPPDITRASESVVILCRGPDNPAAEVACGKLGSGVYWKDKVYLNRVRSGSNDFIVEPYLTSIPCKNDGSPVPYKLLVDYPLIQDGQTPYVYLLLICSEVPTHTINLTNKYKSEIRRGIGISTPTGLDDLYNESNPGHGPQCMLQYIYSA